MLAEKSLSWNSNTYGAIWSTTKQLLWLLYRVVSRKRAHGRYTLLCAQTGGWVDICNIAVFYHEKAPMFTLSQSKTGREFLSDAPLSNLVSE